MPPAEAALIGAVLIDPDALARVAPIARPADFASERAREVYTAMLALDARGVGVDYVTVLTELEARGTLAMVGEANLTGTINACGTSVFAGHYARLVAEAGRARRRAVATPERGAMAL